MEKSKVYFTNMRAKSGESLPKKLKRLIKQAGIETIDFEGKFTAVKIHFGEPGNLAYLRPNYAKAVCDYIKELGGRPFLTDCNTLYVGRRKNALDHLESAYENGYNPFQTGVHTIIADGLKGTDEALVPIKDAVYVKEAKIGRALMDADIVISLSHFKGHECAGFGGALKNIGMGGGSRAGKMEMHSAGKPSVKSNRCIGCGACARICAHNGAVLENGIAHIDHDKCVGCGRCIGVCPKDAIVASMDEKGEILNCKIAEYTKAIIDGRPNFHISLVIDVSPFCDCHGENDAPIVPNIGMFASFDPVALDTACAEAVLKAPILKGSMLDEAEHTHGDHFTDISPNTAWRTQLEHGEAIGIGSMSYELIEVK